MATRTSSSNLVCKICLKANPSNVKLLSFKCLQPVEHRSSPRVPVQYSRHRKMLVEIEPQIRPLPHIKLPPGKRYVLCMNAGGLCSKGDSCTFAHSKSEQEAWNAQLLAEERDAARSDKIRSFITKHPNPQNQQMDFTFHESHFPTLGATIHPTPLAPIFPHSSSWAQTIGPKKHIPTMPVHQHQQFPILSPTSAHVSPTERDGPQARVYQRSASDGKFGAIPQQHKLETAHGPRYPQSRNQSRSQSESSADASQYSQHPRHVMQSQPRQQFDPRRAAEVSQPHHPGFGQPWHHHYPPMPMSHPVPPNPPMVQHNVPYRHPQPQPGGVPALYPQGMLPPRPPAVYSQYQPPVFQQYPGNMMGHPMSAVPQQVDQWPSMSPPATPTFAQPRPSIPTHPQPPRVIPENPHTPHIPHTLHTPHIPHTTHTPSPSVGGGVQDILHSPLSRENYKKKFDILLNLEEKEHKRVLEEKCNGEYNLVLYQYGGKPPFLRRPPEGTRYRRYGYLDDISGDQVAYATQASQGKLDIQNLNGMNICRADILRDNYNHTDERLYIAFEFQEDQKLHSYFPAAQVRGETRFRVVAHFMLKFSYFRNLKSCIQRIQPTIVEKIVPRPILFREEQNQILIDLNSKKELLSDDQFNALEAILMCSAKAPPNIIVGPFGTGKTRILAMAASCFFAEARIKRQPARILVCTQQRESVDNFYEHYRNLLEDQDQEDDVKHYRNRMGGDQEGEDDVEIIILRDQGYKHIDTEKRNIYKTIRSFLSYQRILNLRQNHLIMSTCMAVRELVRDLGDKFFTHILIDEGAQMREPEAIAPLSLAHPDTTKIVIAGDQHQVGPAMLVFGEVPLTCGLATSLLERLYSAYKRLRQESYISTLVTNYRSHPKIFELPSALFYETPLICPQDRDLPPLHPKYPYPLVFLCSSVDDELTEVYDNINEFEAEILLEEVNKFAKSWPTAAWGPLVLEQTCIMSPSRPQLTRANQLISENRLSGRLRAMRRLPTYDMQGREFRALFLSTSEPTNRDASTRNPTKSLCDRHVFNTALTRAQSLVVAAGNPFLLLKTEQKMIERYGKKGKVWSHYLKRCLEHNSFFVPNSLGVKKNEVKTITAKLRALVLECTQPDEPTPSANATKITHTPNEEDFPPLVSPSAVATPRTVASRPDTSQATSNFQHTSPQDGSNQSSAQPRPSYPKVVGTTPASSLSQAVSMSQLEQSHTNQPSANLSDHTLYDLQSTLPLIAGPGTQQPDSDLQRFFPALFGEPVPNQKPLIQSQAQYTQQPTNPAQTPSIATTVFPQGTPTASTPYVSQIQHRNNATNSQPQTTQQPVLFPSSQPVPSQGDSQIQTQSSPVDEEDSVFVPMLVNSQSSLSLSSSFAHDGVEGLASASTGHLQTPSSGVWSGGEMRVSPDRELRELEEASNNHYSKSVTGQNVFSDDTHRRTPSPPLERQRTSSTESMIKNGATPSVASRSRLDEYEVKDQIGRGGFGVVFHVLYKMDETEYALKIIRLSDVPKEQDKVLREVRALAQLDHPHIVRYFYSWKERAPDGWTERGVWSMLRSTDSLPSVLIPVTTAQGSTPTTSSSTQSTPTSAHPPMGSAGDLSQGAFGQNPLATDSVVTFQESSVDSPVVGHARPAQSFKHPSNNIFANTSQTHRHVVSGSPPTCLFIQTELCERKTLRDWLLDHCKEKTRKKSEILDLFKQILDALVHIHGQSLVHRDLKPSNIFFSRRENRIKIGDFGLATTRVALPHGGVDAPRLVSGDSHSKGSVQAGTFLYMSPEQVNGEKYDEKSDMFALGIVFFELQYIMKTDAQRNKVLTVLRSQPMEFPAQFIQRQHYEVTSIVRALLTRDPLKRPTAVQLKEGKYMQSLEKRVRKSKSLYIQLY